MPDYSGPVIDTHHHIWRRKDVPWLAEPPIPRMFGDYFGIRRDYPVEEFMADVMPQGVTKSVHVTANWGLDRALDETRWLQSVSEKHGYPHAFTAQVDLTADTAATLLSELAKFPAVRATVEGHCDERGTREYNLALGARRANAVKEYLVSLGVSTARVDTVSYGKERPI